MRVCVLSAEPDAPGVRHPTQRHMRQVPGGSRSGGGGTGVQLPKGLSRALQFTPLRVFVIVNEEDLPQGLLFE